MHQQTRCRPGAGRGPYAAAEIILRDVSWLSLKNTDRDYGSRPSPGRQWRVPHQPTIVRSPTSRRVPSGTEEIWLRRIPAVRPCSDAASVHFAGGAALPPRWRGAPLSKLRRSVASRAPTQNCLCRADHALRAGGSDNCETGSWAFSSLGRRRRMNHIDARDDIGIRDDATPSRIVKT